MDFSRKNLIVLCHFIFPAFYYYCWHCYLVIWFIPILTSTWGKRNLSWTNFDIVCLYQYSFFNTSIGPLFKKFSGNQLHCFSCNMHNSMAKCISNNQWKWPLGRKFTKKVKKLLTQLLKNLFRYLGSRIMFGGQLVPQEFFR